MRICFADKSIEMDDRVSDRIFYTKTPGKEDAKRFLSAFFYMVSKEGDGDSFVPFPGIKPAQDLFFKYSDIYGLEIVRENTVAAMIFCEYAENYGGLIEGAMEEELKDLGIDSAHIDPKFL